MTECSECGADLLRDEAVDSFLTLYEEEDRLMADTVFQCPECGGVIEGQVEVVSLDA